MIKQPWINWYIEVYSSHDIDIPTVLLISSTPPSEMSSDIGLGLNIYSIMRENYYCYTVTSNIALTVENMCLVDVFGAYMNSWDSAGNKGSWLHTCELQYILLICPAHFIHEHHLRQRLEHAHAGASSTVSSTSVQMRREMCRCCFIAHSPPEAASRSLWSCACGWWQSHTLACSLHMQSWSCWAAAEVLLGRRLSSHWTPPFSASPV